jgi:hypothetical protein
MNNLFLRGIALAFALSFVSGCATHSNKQQAKLKNHLKDTPETVLVTYHVKPGMEKQFEALLDRAWQTYRSEGMVRSEPHVIARDNEENNTIGYVEIFTWVSHAAAQKAPDSVKKIWAEENSMCEARVGRVAIGGGEVQLLVPK